MARRYRWANRLRVACLSTRQAIWTSTRPHAFTTIDTGVSNKVAGYVVRNLDGIVFDLHTDGTPWALSGTIAKEEILAPTSRLPSAWTEAFTPWYLVAHERDPGRACSARRSSTVMWNGSSRHNRRPVQALQQRFVERDGVWYYDFDSAAQRPSSRSPRAEAVSTS